MGLIRRRGWSQQRIRSIYCEMYEVSPSSCKGKSKYKGMNILPARKICQDHMSMSICPSFIQQVRELRILCDKPRFISYPAVYNDC